MGSVWWKILEKMEDTKRSANSKIESKVVEFKADRCIGRGRVLVSMNLRSGNSKAYVKESSGTAWSLTYITAYILLELQP